MVEISLECAIIGQAGTFDVTIDDGTKISALKEVIRAKTPKNIKDDAKDLQLFLAKKGNAWLSAESEAASCLVKGKPHGDIRIMIDGEEMAPLRLKGLLEKNNMEEVSFDQIHILVVVPDITTTIKVNESQGESEELAYYQSLGQGIQYNCQENCSAIQEKNDAMYAETRSKTKPFICVEGSSGMGKSQLVFALGGEGREIPRPWFYWPLASSQTAKQRVYKNFSSTAKA